MASLLAVLLLVLLPALGVAPPAQVHPEQIPHPDDPDQSLLPKGAY
jgi:hypothetical protein